MSEDKRFHMGWNSDKAVVVDIPIEQYNKGDSGYQREHQLVAIRIGGMISQRLAATYVKQICDQLNQFDIANATVAKLS